MNKIINQKLFVLLLTLSSMMIFIVSIAQGAEPNRDDTALLSQERLSDRNAIETVIDQYFQSRYEVRATMQTQDFNGTLADSRKAHEFRQAELDRQEIEIHQAKLFGLDYVEYKYFINIKEIQFNDEEGTATVTLEESHDVIFSSTQPIISKMYNLEHVILLTKTATGWQIINDTYMDYLNKILSETGMTKEEVIEALDQSYAEHGEKSNNPSESTYSTPILLSPSYYNQSGAVSYAHQYAYNYNPAYPNFNGQGGDCTNFVSQALYAGGINQTSQIWNGWWISPSNHGTAWTAVEALDDMILQGPSSGSGGPRGYNAGGAWGVTGGDVVQYEWGNNNGGWDHSVIVVYKRGYYPNALAYVASHNPDHDWYPHYYFSYSGIRFFHITGQW